MDKRGILLIAERGYDLGKDLHTWAHENGHQLICVDNIKDVLMTLQKERVNVLVLDACLPEEMGYEAISIIKGLCHNLPIIVTADENNPELFPIPPALDLLRTGHNQRANVRCNFPSAKTRTASRRSEMRESYSFR